MESARGARILGEMLRRALLVPLLLSVVACTDLGGSDANGSADRSGAVAISAGLEPVDDPDCDTEAIGDDGETLVAAMTVRDGVPSGLCLGEPSPELDAAWEELVAVVPAAQLADLAVFAGFDDAESDVLAFATMLGDANDRFGIVVNLAAAQDDPEQFRLTLAHEVAHVFTQTPDQLDVDVDPADCPTFHNGNGCFRPGSLVAAWIDRFWSEEQLAQVEAKAGSDQAGTDEAGAEDRCALDPGFPGQYAASSPEEDLAESFAAYVFGLDVPAEVQPRLDFFAEHPELRGFTELAAADDRGRPETAMEECGA